MYGRRRSRNRPKLAPCRPMGNLAALAADWFGSADYQAPQGPVVRERKGELCEPQFIGPSCALASRLNWERRLATLLWRLRRRKLRRRSRQTQNCFILATPKAPKAKSRLAPYGRQARQLELREALGCYNRSARPPRIGRPRADACRAQFFGSRIRHVRGRALGLVLGWPLARSRLRRRTAKPQAAGRPAAGGSPKHGDGQI